MFGLSSTNFLLLIHFLLPSFAYVITTEPWQTDRPAPGLTLFYDIQVEQNDTVVLVDILLFNGSRGNTTTIFGNSDLRKQDDRNAGFDIPFVPPGTAYAIRLVETSTKRFLQDSPQFQIFAVSLVAVDSTSLVVSSIPPTTLATPSGLSTASITALSSTSLPSTSPAGAGNSPPTTGSSKSKNVAPIVGGVIGIVVLVIATIIAIILWRRRSPKSVPTNETEKVLPKAVRLGSVQPFVLHPSNASPVDTSGPNSAEVSPYTLSPVIGSATQASLLPKKSAHGHPVDTRDASSSPSASNTVPARAELLRQERERINREITTLESRSATSDSRNGGSSYGTDLSDSSSYPIMASAPPVPIVGTINEQLASLREQIRQIEQVYGPRGLAVMGDEPPPVYDGPPSGAIIGGSRPLPNVRPLGDGKEG